VVGRGRGTFMSVGGVLFWGAAIFIAPAIAASWWCDKLFGGRYMNRANILHPKSRAANYWNRTYLVFLVVELTVLALALIGKALPSADEVSPAAVPASVTSSSQPPRAQQAIPQTGASSAQPPKAQQATPQTGTYPAQGPQLRPCTGPTDQGPCQDK
jgi:hypothetical protein